MENFRSPEKENIFEHGLRLGSTSTHKLDALKEACSRLGIDADITSVSAKSEVNAQPYGFDETYGGAMNRAKNAQAGSPQAVTLGIESGIIPVGDKFIDLAVIVVLTPDGKSFIGTSVGMEFPKSVVEEARLRGFTTTTVGDVVAETMGGSKTDPHTTLTGGRISRKELLIEAISSVLSGVLSA